MKLIQINQGDQYGRLTIIKEVEPHIQSNGNNIRKVEAICECGNVKSYKLCNLRSGATASCGCFKIDRVKETNTTHGLCRHPLYNVWKNIIQRCANHNNNDFKNYGGRGITICDEWNNDFQAFYDDMNSGYAKGLDIDRIDNDRGYSKENCRWISKSENNLNRRIYGAVKYRGVFFNKVNAKYMASISINGKSKYIGLFTTALEAAQAYDQYVKDNNLPNQLNF